MEVSLMLRRRVLRRAAEVERHIEEGRRRLDVLDEQSRRISGRGRATR